MQLTEEQRQKVTEWIAQGLKLSEIQDRMGSEFELRMTYMDARLLVDDLKLTPKDPVVPEAPKPPVEPALAPAEAAPADAGLAAAAPVEGDAPASSGQCSVTVDAVTKAGTMVSGKASFSDGQTAEWYLDQMGRFGLIPSVEGYRPPQQDVAEVQMLLDRELAKLGY